MNHKSDMDLLQAYLGGELPADQVAALRAQLNAEPGLCDQLLILAREETILSEWARSTSQAERILFDPYHQWLGIQPKDQPPNRYRLLGIEPLEDDPAVIGNAADQRMAHLRSFQSGRHSRDSQRLLNEVAAAKICLLSGERKAEYDQDLRLKMQADSAKMGRPDAVVPAVPPLVQPIDFGKRGLSVRSSDADKRKRQAILAGFVVAGVALVLIVGAYFAITSGRDPSEEQQAGTVPEGKPDDSAGSLPTPPRLVGGLIEEPAGERNTDVRPSATDLAAPSSPPGDASLEVTHVPAGQPIAALPHVPETGAGRAAATQGESAVADQLLEFTLALSLTDDATEQMWIYQQMASTLLANVAQTDPDDEMAGQFLGNYVQLIQEGVLPRLVVIRLADEQGRLSGVAGSLQTDCRILETLFARGGSPPQGSLAKARMLSNRCRTTAKSL